MNKIHTTNPVKLPKSLAISMLKSGNRDSRYWSAKGVSYPTKDIVYLVCHRDNHEEVKEWLINSTYVIRSKGHGFKFNANSVASRSVVIVNDKVTNSYFVANI